MAFLANLGANWKEYLDAASEIFMIVSIVASFIAHTFKLKSAEDAINSTAGKFLKFVSIFPILGTSKRTKMLEAAVVEMIHEKTPVPNLPVGTQMKFPTDEEK